MWSEATLPEPTKAVSRGVSHSENLLRVHPFDLCPLADRSPPCCLSGIVGRALGEDMPATALPIWATGGPPVASLACDTWRSLGGLMSSSLASPALVRLDSPELLKLPRPRRRMSHRPRQRQRCLSPTLFVCQLWSHCFTLRTSGPPRPAMRTGCLGAAATSPPNPTSATLSQRSRRSEC